MTLVEMTNDVQKMYDFALNIPKIRPPSNSPDSGDLKSLQPGNRQTKFDKQMNVKQTLRKCLCINNLRHFTYERIKDSQRDVIPQTNKQSITETLNFWFLHSKRQEKSVQNTFAFLS